jgi:predicted dehydrogenase
VNEQRPVPVGVVGIGHYALTYVNCMFTMEEEGLGKLGAAVVRTRGKYPVEAELVKRGVAIRASMEEMLERDRGRIEMVGLPTGIESHRDQMIQAVEAGMDVILEKPAAATVQDFDAMEAALARTGRFCAIGFQNQYKSTTLALKREIVAGRLGRIRDVTVEGLWQRDDDYYKRTGWAGKLAVDGRCVLDGTINNPMAHYLFNGLFFASREHGKAAAPVSVRAELYHGHRIESEDTACLEALCENGARVLFYGSLCSEAENLIRITVRGEKGEAIWKIEGPVPITDGRHIHELHDAGDDPRPEIFRNALRFHRGVEKELTCPLSMTRSHVLAVNGAFESAGLPRDIPAEYLNIHQKEVKGRRITLTPIVGIDELVQRAAQKRKLFSDMDVPWAYATKGFSMEGYKEFRLPG